MRQAMHGAIVGARDILKKVTDSVVQGNQLTEDELLNRYTTQHRGNAAGMAEFVSRHMPPGANALGEMRRYEQAMEQKLKARGGQMMMGALQRGRNVNGN